MSCRCCRYRFRRVHRHLHNISEAKEENKAVTYGELEQNGIAEQLVHYRLP